MFETSGTGTSHVVDDLNLHLLKFRMTNIFFIVSVNSENFTPPSDLKSNGGVESIVFPDSSLGSDNINSIIFVIVFFNEK